MGGHKDYSSRIESRNRSALMNPLLMVEVDCTAVEKGKLVEN